MEIEHFLRILTRRNCCYSASSHQIFNMILSFIRRAIIKYYNNATYFNAV